MIDDKQQRLRPPRCGNMHPANALRARVVKFDGKHSEITLPAQRAQQAPMARTHGIGRHHLVIENRNPQTHGTPLETAVSSAADDAACCSGTLSGCLSSKTLR